MTSSNKSKLIIDKADIVNDREEILHLWKEGFPGEKNFDQKLDWFYASNPSGKASIFLLKKDGMNIGVKGIGGKNWLLNRSIIKAGLFSDLAVKKEYRTVGPALQLISETVKSVSSEFPLLYGFPNEKSVVVYKRGGFKLLGMINRYAKPLQYSFYIAKTSKIISVTLGRIVDKIISFYEKLVNFKLHRLYSCEIDNQFDESFNTLWSLAESNGFCMAQRNTEFLSWRFINSRFQSINVFTVKSKSDNNLVGYVVYSIVSNKVATVHDFFAANEKNHLLVLLKLFNQQMRKMECSSVSLAFFGAKQFVDIIKQAGFKFRDSQPIVYKLNIDNAEVDSLNWYITSADRDT